MSRRSRPSPLMDTADERQQRLRTSALDPRLSEAARRALLLEYEEEGLPSPVLDAHRQADLARGLTDVVNLSAGGQIHRLPPPTIVKQIQQAIDEGRFHYPGVRGDETLRVALAEKLRRDNGIEADPDREILPTAGAQMAIDGALRILVNPGDEVLLIDPDYASIEPVIRAYGGRPIAVRLRDTPGGWTFDPDEVRRRVTRRTRLFCFSNGNNPTGYLYSNSDLEALAAIAQEFDLFVFSDEEYEKLIFDGRRHQSIAALPGMAARTVTAFSFSKAYSLSGLRIGYMVSPPHITDHMANVIRFSAQAVGSLGQAAALGVLSGSADAWLRDVVADLEADRDYATARLNAIPGVRVHAPAGCYFLFARVDADGRPAWELAEYLLREARITVVSGHHFGRSGRHYLRVSGCVGRPRLVEGLDRMAGALDRLRESAGPQTRKHAGR